MRKQNITVIGAGWAGLAAAVQLTHQGHIVTVFESAKQAGGRARSVRLDNLIVDNGQHILIGAYRESLRLMKLTGVDFNTSLKRLPLLLHVIDKNKTLTLKGPALPAPFHLLYALLTAKALSFKDKLAAVKFGLILKKNNYSFNKDISVAELFNQTNQPEILIRQLWEPLCLATMNTSIHEASANVFMRVFKDAFTNKRKDADLLIPTVDLSRLFPETAINYITRHGGEVHLKSRIEKINIKDNKLVSITSKTNQEIMTHDTSQAIIATAPQHLEKLLSYNPELEDIKNSLGRFSYEPIVTVYLQFENKIKLALPMTGLSSTLSQWVFDRDTICKQPGLVSVIISSGGKHMQLDDAKLIQTVFNEISTLIPAGNKLINSYVIREKRATFSCTIGINDTRPGNSTGIDGLYIAGDYTNTDYPATIEGAVRSGLKAANLITGIN